MMLRLGVTVGTGTCHPRKPKKLWSAPPHTLAKLAILRKYLIAYFAILGRRTDPSREILYIDGFAGPNEYLDHPRGSPTER